MKNKIKKLITSNLKNSKDEELKKDLIRFNIISFFALILGIAIILLYEFILKIPAEMKKGLYITNIVVFYFLINLLIILLFPKTLFVLKKLFLIFVSVYIIIISIISGGFTLKSTTINLLFFLIVITSFLDEYYFSIAIILGNVLSLLHTIIFFINPTLILVFLDKIKAQPMYIKFDVLFFPFIYFVSSILIFLLLQSNKKYKKTMINQGINANKELLIAKETLNSFYSPTPYWFMNNIEIDCYQEPFMQIGGDFFLFEEFDDSYYFFLIDICGHGISASLFTVFLKKELQQSLSSSLEKTLEIFTKKVYNFLDSVNKQCAITAIQFISKKEIKYINNGNFIYSLDLKNTNKVEILNQHGYGLSFNYMSSNYKINNKILIITTDGIIESVNKNKKEFNIKNSFTDSRLIVLRNNIIKDYHNYIENNIKDDITIILMKNRN